MTKIIQLQDDVQVEIEINQDQAQEISDGREVESSIDKIQDLLKKVTEYHNITLKIDRYWMLQTDKEGKKKVTTLSGSNYVGEDKMLVECSIMCNMKRYIFHRNEEIVFDEESYIELKKDLIEFMEKYSAKNGKEV